MVFISALAKRILTNGGQCIPFKSYAILDNVLHNLGIATPKSFSREPVGSLLEATSLIRVVLAQHEAPVSA